MIQTIQRGQRAPLTNFLQGKHLTLHTHLPNMAGADVSLFGLDEERKLSDDRYFIFYNQPSSPEGAIQLGSGGEVLLDLERVPLGVHRLLLAATSDERTFSELGHGAVNVRDDQGGQLLFELGQNMFTTEQAVMLLEIYRHSGEWRVTGVAQGFSGGLAALIQSFGGEVAEEAGAGEVGDEAHVDWSDSLERLKTIFGRPAPTEPEEWEPLRSAPEYGRTRHEVTRGLQNFRTRFLAATADGVIEWQEWRDLQNTIDLEKLDAKEALEFVRSDSLDLLERTLTIAQADGSVTEAEEVVFKRLVTLLQMPDSLTQPLWIRLEELRLADRLRAGHLPTIESTLILEAGEVAHLEMPATYRHVTASKTRDIKGHVVLTNRQMHFVSSYEGGWTVQYGKVLRISSRSGGVKLELSVKKGSGLYRRIPQPLIFEATLEALVRMHKRLLMMPQGEKASRSIPQKVKLEVWQRDQGKCVECGDTNYLEFDHVIPHSLGGASTVDNLQILCRRCNLAKSDRI